MRKREKKTRRKKHVSKRKEQDPFERKLRDIANMQLKLDSETIKSLRALFKQDECEYFRVLTSLVCQRAEDLGLMDYDDSEEEGTDDESEQEEEENSALATQL